MLPNQQVMSDSANKQAVVNNMFNLTICLNNCKMFDSSYAVSTKILEIDPDNANVLTNAGRYHKQLALAANDSATYYSKQGDTAAAKMWRQKKDEEFVKAVNYLQKSFELQPESVPAAEELGIIAFLLEKYDLAATAFTQATKLDSTNYEDWTSLGDCYLRLQDWQKSADAYEKSLALKPNNKTVMEQLVLLYQELGKKKLADEMQAKLKNL
jgi:tetratricopeptide (TPR) repeat protein